MAGVTLNPSTPVCLLKDIIHELDLVLLMSVNPGFGGQKFIPHTVNKVKELREMIEEHKVNKEIEPLKISRGAMKMMLTSCGVDDAHVKEFSERYTEEFGKDTALSPKNLMETKKFEVTTPDVTIKVNPDRSDLIETRVIDGEQYILIRADEGVEVNGVRIRIAETEE